MFRLVRWLVLMCGGGIGFVAKRFEPDYLILKYILTGKHPEDWIPFPKPPKEIEDTSKAGRAARMKELSVYNPGSLMQVLEECNKAADAWVRRTDSIKDNRILEALMPLKEVGSDRASAVEYALADTTDALARGLANRLYNDSCVRDFRSNTPLNAAIIAEICDFPEIKDALVDYALPFKEGSFSNINQLRGHVGNVLLIKNPWGIDDCQGIVRNLAEYHVGEVSFFRLEAVNAYDLPLKTFFYQLERSP